MIYESHFGTCGPIYCMVGRKLRRKSCSFLSKDSTNFLKTKSRIQVFAYDTKETKETSGDTEGQSDVNEELKSKDNIENSWKNSEISSKQSDDEYMLPSKENCPQIIITKCKDEAKEKECPRVINCKKNSQWLFPDYNIAIELKKKVAKEINSKTIRIIKNLMGKHPKLLRYHKKTYAKSMFYQTQKSECS